MFAALVFSVSIPVCCAVPENLIIWAYITIVVFVVYILIFPEETLFCHRTFIREQWVYVIINKQLCYRWSFISGICDQCFNTDVFDLVV